MNQELRNQIEAVIRIVVPLIGSLAVSLGWISADKVGELGQQLITGLVGVITLASVVWAIWVNRKVKQIDNVASFPDVKAVVTTPQIANEDLKENPKVVAHQAA